MRISDWSSDVCSSDLRAAELAKQHGWFLASQFENPANPAYHRQTTAAEILRDYAGRRLDPFVRGWGTGGTLTGEHGRAAVWEEVGEYGYISVGAGCFKTKKLTY